MRRGERCWLGATLTLTLTLGMLAGCGAAESDDETDVVAKATEALTVQVLEAETFKPSSTKIVPYADTNASAGKALVYWVGGSGSLAATTGSAAHVTVRARGDQCNGAPTMALKIDGTQVLSKPVVGTTFADFEVDVALAAGAHTFDIAFTNDGSQAGVCDRNLRVDKITLTPPDGVGAGSAPVGTACGAVNATVTPTMSTAAIQGVLDAQPIGAAICFATGTYRITTPLSPRQNQTLHGAPGAVLDGAVVLSDWASSGSAWVKSGVTFSYGGSESIAERWCEDPTAHPCSFPEDVFEDGLPLRRVTARSMVVAGTFFNDYANHAVYIGSDPHGHLLELGTTQAAMRVNAAGVVVEGLTIEKFASLFNRGALEVNAAGGGSTVQNCEVRYNHVKGVAVFGSGVHVLRNRFHDNGALGMSVGGDDVETDHNDLVHNNIDGFWRMDGVACGIKVDLAANAVTTNNLIRDNNGNGIWHDEAADNGRIQGNVIDNNFHNGVQIETTRTALVTNNTVTNNGLLQATARGRTNCTGLTCAAGIFVNDGASIEIANNTVSGNFHGIAMVQVSRTPRTSAYTIPNLTNNYVHDNTVTLSRGQVGIAFTSAPAGFDPYAASSNNRFVHNTYKVPTTSSPVFYWARAVGDWSRWRSFGEDTTGSIQILP